MNFKKNLAAMDKLVVAGKFEEAVSTYFADNATTVSPGDSFRTSNKSEKISTLQYFFGNIERTNRIEFFEATVKGNVSESVFTFDFTNRQGENLVWNEAIRRVWSDNGLVVSEEYVAVSPKTEVEPSATPAQSTKKPVKKAVAKSEKDDLKLIEGIGPKIEELLNKAGIATFAKLATTPAETVKNILNEAGKRYQMHDPTTWAAQSQLAADGKLAELKTWQNELKGGK